MQTDPGENSDDEFAPTPTPPPLSDFLEQSPSTEADDIQHDIRGGVVVRSSKVLDTGVERKIAEIYLKKRKYMGADSVPTPFCTLACTRTI